MFRRSPAQYVYLWPSLLALLAAIAVIGAPLRVPAHTQAHLLWFEHGKLKLQAKRMLAVLRDAEAFGLHSSDYGLHLSPADMRSVLAGDAPSPLQMSFDARLSLQAGRFAEHIHNGRVSPQAAGFQLQAPGEPLDVATAVRDFAVAQDVRVAVAALEPRPRPYHLLKEALARYRALALHPQLTQLPTPARTRLGLGDTYSGVPQLRALLVALGDLTKSASSGPDDLLTAPLIDALRRFQARHGLAADGVLGNATFAALTIPLDRRVQQIELAMERWRWLAAVGRPQIVVNIPQYMLYALPPPGTAGRPLLEMPVIVGRNSALTRTRVFTAAIDQVIFQPYWDVPGGILSREMLPLIREDISYLERNHLEMVRGPGDDAVVVPPSPAAVEELAAGRLRLRQRPGLDNALGAVKFRMPNPYNVYLHATPEQALFLRAQRRFSHGCVRVSEPAVLAEFVLHNAGTTWDAKAIKDAMDGGTTQRVALKIPVRVVIFYSTAAVTTSSGVLFFEDIYGLDRRLQRLLEQARS